MIAPIWPRMYIVLSIDWSAGGCMASFIFDGCVVLGRGVSRARSGMSRGLAPVILDIDTLLREGIKIPYRKCFASPIDKK
jgi:hypothetical protein